MRKALLPILAVVLLLLTGTWAVDVFLGSGGGAEGGTREGDLDVLDLEDPEDAAAAGDGRAGVTEPPPRLQRTQPAAAGSAPKASLVGTAARPEDEPEEVWDAASSGGDTVVGRTGTVLDELLVTSGSEGADDEAWLPPGLAWVGTPQRWIDGVAQRHELAADVLQREVPRHAVEILDGLWIERYEVTEERYRTFLEQASLMEFRTPLGRAKTLVETAGELITNRDTLYEYELAARQLYQANRAALVLALSGSVSGDAEPGSEDAEREWERVKDARLPRGVKLRFYDRAPPYYWPDDRYPAGRADHPVRDLSLEDALAFATWAGKHLPSELVWEYAARGPRGADFPWEGSGKRFDALVNGGRLRGEGEEPNTLQIRSLPEGASWVECHHVLGNVAEWTRTWPYPYPGNDLVSFAVGTPRGGSAANTDRLWVRPALRGSRPEASDDAPDPRRAWMGARLARFPQPARSRVFCMQMRVRLSPALRVAPEVLEERVYAGVEGRLEGRIFEPRQDASVRMGVKAFVVQPLAVVPRVTDASGTVVAFEPGVDDGVVDLETLLAASVTGPVLLGLFHNDLVLESTYALVGQRAQTRAKLVLRRAPTPPDSWWVCLFHGHLALWAPQRPEADRWRFLTRRPVTPTNVSVLTRRTRDDQPPAPKADLGFAGASNLSCELESWLGSAVRPNLVVRVRFKVRTLPQIASRVSNWQPGRLER